MSDWLTKSNTRASRPQSRRDNLCRTCARRRQEALAARRTEGKVVLCELRGGFRRSWLAHRRFMHGRHHEGRRGASATLGVTSPPGKVSAEGDGGTTAAGLAHTQRLGRRQRGGRRRFRKPRGHGSSCTDGNPEGETVGGVRPAKNSAASFLMIAVSGPSLSGLENRTRSPIQAWDRHTRGSCLRRHYRDERWRLP